MTCATPTEGHQSLCARHIKYYKQAKRRWSYGVTPEEYEAMLEAQGGACAICRRSDQPLVLDHDHKTDKPRGLLCQGCNHGLGNFLDDPVALRMAAQYLVERA